MKKRTGGLRAEASRAEGAYKRFGSVTQNLGAGAIHLPRACKVDRVPTGWNIRWVACEAFAQAVLDVAGQPREV